MEQTWVEQVAQGPYAAYWLTAPSQNLFPPTSVAPAPSSGSAKTSDTVDNSKKRSRVATQPFVAQKPLLAFPTGSVPSESPFTMLKDKNTRDWPQLPDPQGKTASRQICFHCCFPAPYNKCEDPETCSFRNKNQPFLRRKPAKAVLQRFHVDLAESKWRNQEKYPENNWDDLVRFLKSHRDLVAPSAEIKVLTPSAGSFFHVETYADRMGRAKSTENPCYRASVPTKPAVQSAQSMSGPSHKGTDHVFDHQQNILRRRNCMQNMVWRSWLMQPSRWREKSQPRNNNQQKPNDSRNDKSGRVVIEVHWRGAKLPRHLQPASSRTSRGAKAAPVINAQHRKRQKFSLVCRRRTMMVLIPNWNRVWVDELNYPREDSIDYSYNWWYQATEERSRYAKVWAFT
eukprot:scaffold6748_cov73-Cylindrotheca_fusiformis.AAC.1